VHTPVNYFEENKMKRLVIFLMVICMVSVYADGPDSWAFTHNPDDPFTDEALLTEKNPYTGIPLKDDPAFAVLQIVSEDSLFFHWTNDIKGGPRRLLETMFGDFVREKYGDLDSAFSAWGGGAEVKGDDRSAGRLGLYIHWAIEQWPGQGNIKRIRDQVEFFANTEYMFFKKMKKYLRDELGAQQIITASNFGSADEVRLGDLQR
jgi:hypothetical protein